MTASNPELVEKYQLEYQKNPRSKIFAALAEAYRKMGLLEEALRICEQGVEYHPDFASGRVAYARLLYDKQDFAKALEHLQSALQISPDNLLAHSLMGEVQLKLRRPKEALKAFKMALFFNPLDQRAQQAVKKWEFLTADEYEEDLFSMQPVREVSVTIPLARQTPMALSPQRQELEKVLSMADAFTIRNELEKAIQTLKTAKKELGALPEINNRLSLLAGRMASLHKEEATATLRLSPLNEPAAQLLVQDDPAQNHKQRYLLETFLRRIQQRRLTP